MSHLLPSYLHTLRKQWGFSQPDLAVLLGVTGSALSRFEGRSRRPSAKLLIGAQIIFGENAKDVFPAFYRDVQRAILKRARSQQRRLQGKSDSASRRKLQLLNEILERTSQISLDV